MKKSLIAGAAALLSAAAPAATTVDDLAWLAGEWTSETADSVTEERWSTPLGGTMLGTSRTVRGGAMREFEFLQVTAGEDGTPMYIAQPGGAPSVSFRLVKTEASSAVFENPAHDYPQRIVYVRNGSSLTATISAIDGSKAMSWTLTRR